MPAHSDFNNAITDAKGKSRRYKTDLIMSRVVGTPANRINSAGDGIISGSSVAFLKITLSRFPLATSIGTLSLFTADADQIGRSSHYVFIGNVEMARNLVSDELGRPILFRDLWLRPGLAPRDRSLVTISSLVASGQAAQLTGHVNIGMNNGLTQVEIAEALTHLAFYVGWPNVFSAMPMAKDVFEKRPR